ncbi:MAG: hydrogenase nickel incorporation protein HypB [Acidobacteria bacterium]|nr:hydrogenase nickel incorporation protein HypB [Acidobacteriota bacterium]
MAEIVDVRRSILEANEAAATQVRGQLARALVVNLISSPGSGKTSLLEATMPAIKDSLSLAVIEGDIATDRDAQRLRALGVPAVQILTGGACHLDARQVLKVLAEGHFQAPDVLFIENVGNLICPTSYDLGEDFKVALLSVTEGDDKPFKYPAIFATAQVTVITKVDLLPYVTFDLDAVKAQMRSLNPTGSILLTSARTGQGLDQWIGMLRSSLDAKRRAPA